MTVSAKEVRNILSKNILADGFSPIMDIEKSKGSYLVDQVTGDSYLDMFSMFASASVGYNHPKIIKNISWIIPARTTPYDKFTAKSNLNKKEIKRVKIKIIFKIIGAAAAAANLLYEFKIPEKNDDKLTNNKKGRVILVSWTANSNFSGLL